MTASPGIQRDVPRIVGIAALRRLRRMVDADNALAAEMTRRGRRLPIFFLLADRSLWPGC